MLPSLKSWIFTEDDQEDWEPALDLHLNFSPNIDCWTLQMLGWSFSNRGFTFVWEKALALLLGTKYPRKMIYFFVPLVKKFFFQGLGLKVFSNNSSVSSARQINWNVCIHLTIKQLEITNTSRFTLPPFIWIILDHNVSFLCSIFLLIKSNKSQVPPG